MSWSPPPGNEDFTRFAKEVEWMCNYAFKRDGANANATVKSMTSDEVENLLRTTAVVSGHPPPQRSGKDWNFWLNIEGDSAFCLYPSPQGEIACMGAVLTLEKVYDVARTLGDTIKSAIELAVITDKPAVVPTTPFFHVVCGPLLGENYLRFVITMRVNNTARAHALFVERSATLIPIEFAQP